MNDRGLMHGGGPGRHIAGSRPGVPARFSDLFSRARRRRSDDEGAVLIEFALVIGLFFLLVFGMVDFGLAINAKTQMTNAGREGARLGTVNLDADAITARVKEVAGSLDEDILVVTVTCVKQPPDEADPCVLAEAVSGDSVIVTLDYKYSLITPLPGFIDSDNKIDLQSVTEMRVE